MATNGRRQCGMGLWALPLIAVLVSAPTLAAGKSDSVKVYRWVDKDGVTHYGDQVPPEYAGVDRVVLNRYGVEVGREDGGPSTPEELAAAEAAKARLEAENAAIRRDRVLLSTYLSVEEIVALRDRRKELMDGQILLTEHYLNSLRSKLTELQTEAGAFRPYNPDPEALPIDESLAEELSDTLESIALYERTLADTRTRQVGLMARFKADIDRFQELAANNQR